MSNMAILILSLIQNIGDLVFWALLLVAIWKYRIFDSLPRALFWPMILGGILSAIAVIAIQICS